MLEIKEYDDVDLVFPTEDLGWLPMEEIPEEFKRHNGTEWNEIVSAWFFNGLSKKVEFIPKEGVDAEKAFRQLRATIGSWGPKHEHKEAAMAYMMSEWFQEIRNWKK